MKFYCFIRVRRGTQDLWGYQDCGVHQEQRSATSLQFAYGYADYKFNLNIFYMCFQGLPGYKGEKVS